jgi:hypothetical protein
MERDGAERRVCYPESDVVFLGFALNECTLEVPAESVRYVRAIHRTALELAIQNSFGADIGGFWLTTEQIAQLRSLSEYYSIDEAPQVAQAIEAYLTAQLEGIGLYAT